MRKIVLLVNVSLDGFAASPDGGLDWVIVDDEMWAYTNALFDEADATLFGRVTYEGFAQAWPAIGANPESPKVMKDFAAWIERVEKIVVTRTLQGAAWNNTRLVRDDVAGEVSRLKALPGKDVVVMGSPSLARILMGLGLIDEFRVNLNPVILGEGIKLFEGNERRVGLRLEGAKQFASGVVGLHYRAQRGA